MWADWRGGCQWRHHNTSAPRAISQRRPQRLGAIVRDQNGRAGSSTTAGWHKRFYERADRSVGNFTRSRRSVILGRGEALFEVAHDSARPFVVIAGNGSITAVGTTFDVRKDADRVVCYRDRRNGPVSRRIPESVTELGVQPHSILVRRPHVRASDAWSTDRLR